MLTVRFSDIEDYHSIREFDPHSEYIDPNRIKSKITLHEILIAQDDIGIKGMLKFSFLWMTRPYIDLIYVEPKHRKSGISRSLLNFLEKYLAKQGYAFLFSSAEEKDNKAQQWHEHMGFAFIGKLEGLNLPHEKTAELFYSKKISENDSLIKYSLF